MKNKGTFAIPQCGLQFRHACDSPAGTQSWAVALTVGPLVGIPTDRLFPAWGLP